jgi:hypothetical protein
VLANPPVRVCKLRRRDSSEELDLAVHRQAGAVASPHRVVDSKEGSIDEIEGCQFWHRVCVGTFAVVERSNRDAVRAKSSLFATAVGATLQTRITPQLTLAAGRRARPRRTREPPHRGG